MQTAPRREGLHEVVVCCCGDDCLEQLPPEAVDVSLITATVAMPNQPPPAAPWSRCAAGPDLPHPSSPGPARWNAPG